MDIEIELGGQTVALRPTLGALKAINQMGGVVPVLDRLARMDFDAYTAVVAAGLGKRAGEVEKSVFEAGMTALNAPLTRFLLVVANGGRDPDKREEDAKQGEA